MSWQNHCHHHNLERKCKIRKRGCSSSSSSSLVRKYRFKRAILMGKRGGSSTPVPTWETTTRSVCGTMQNAEFLKQNSKVDGGKGKEVSALSARKLGATLWGIDQVPTKKKDSQINEDSKLVRRSREKSAKLPSQSAILPQHLSDPSYTPFSEVGFIFQALLFAQVVDFHATHASSI